jgi:hypothetical protein
MHAKEHEEKKRKEKKKKERNKDSPYFQIKTFIQKESHDSMGTKNI